MNSLPDSKWHQMHRELFAFAHGAAARLWKNMFGDEWKAAVKLETLHYLHTTLREPNATVEIEWFGIDITDVRIVERSAIDRLAELA